ncbi:MAG: CehA/McbA family metallohydrolase [Eubacteriales bacterium]|nr:CehA/McbA family metallohydrolase [Eubacteriales bacterium]
METVKTFTRLVTPQEERQYLRIPFEMGLHTASLTITYDYTRHREFPGGPGITLRGELNIIDLALEAPDGTLVGASGSERREITIHENCATPGYIGFPLHAGTWRIVLGAYKVHEDGCPVSISITQTPKEPVLLKGDCHTHTVHSDGWYTVEEAIARARQDRLDFLFITDHNSMASNTFIRSFPDIAVLPGVEVTYYGGHYNLFGVSRPIKTYTANTPEEVLAIMREGRANGALISINHPCDGNCPWTFGLGNAVSYDMMEIWNGAHTPDNQKAIDLWHGQLCQGQIRPVIGGSDSHHAQLFRNYATPATFLYAKSNGKSDILDAMKSGHAFIGMSVDAPHISLEMGEARMGDIYMGGQAPLRLRIGGLLQEDEVLLMNQTGRVFSDKPGKCFKYEAEVDVSGSLFVRAEVRRALPGGFRTLTSISNPIYLRPGREAPQ